MTRKKKAGDLILLTGGTGFIGSRLALALAGQGYEVALLVRRASRPRLEGWLQAQDPGPGRLSAVEGDLLAPELGLPAAERDRVLSGAREFFHLAAAYHLALSAAEAHAVNLDGTRQALALAARCRALRGFHHMSTIAVSGDATGEFPEDALEVGQRFFHEYGRSKYEAEREVRARAGDLPVTIYRPGAVVGDSQTGAFDKQADGAYYALRVLLQLRRALPLATRLPMIVPKEPDGWFHLVPVDYVVRAILHLATLPRIPAVAGAAPCYHLTDPNPPTFGEFYCAALDALGFRGPRIARPVRRLFWLLRQPGLWQATRFGLRAFGIPAEMLPHVQYPVRYDTRRARAALEPAGIRCPAALEILPRLVAAYEAEES